MDQLEFAALQRLCHIPVGLIHLSLVPHLLETLNNELQVCSKYFKSLLHHKHSREVTRPNLRAGF